MIEIYDITNTIFTSKTYILSKEGSDKAWLVDIGDVEPVLEYLNERGLSVEGVFLTHAHFDHCWGVNQLVEKYSLPIVCSELCADAIKYEKRNCSVFYDNREAFSIYQRTISIESLDNELWFGVFRIRLLRMRKL